MNKFKVGDRVVVIKTLPDFEVGTKAIVEKLFELDGVSLDIDPPSVKHLPWDQEYFEIDHQYYFKQKLEKIINE